MGSRIVENKSEGICECRCEIPFFGAISDKRFDVMGTNYLKEFHEKAQGIDSYLGIIKYFARRTGKEKEGVELINYMKKELILSILR
jgi:hypothetical protein